jgi:hypothetical protein
MLVVATLTTGAACRRMCYRAGNDGAEGETDFVLLVFLLVLLKITFGKLNYFN